MRSRRGKLQRVKTMEKEKIEQAAMDYVEQYYPDCHPLKKHDISLFIQGARWRIDSAWHDGTASCEARRKALVLFKNGNAAVYKDLRDIWFEQLWDEVDKFAYLADLLPDTRKEAEP